MLNAYLFCLLAGVVLISFSLNDDGGVDGEGGPLSLLFSTCSGRLGSRALACLAS